MAISALKTGDVVKLKSGGPLMTVSDATQDKIECSWFVDGNIQHSSFAQESLKAFQGKDLAKTSKETERA